MRPGCHRLGQNSQCDGEILMQNERESRQKQKGNELAKKTTNKLARAGMTSVHDR